MTPHDDHELTDLEETFQEEFGDEPTLSAQAQRELERYRVSPEAMRRRLHRLLLFYESATLQPEARERLVADQAARVIEHLDDVDARTQQAIIELLRRLGLAETGEP